MDLEQDFIAISKLLINSNTPPHVLADVYKHLSTLLYTRNEKKPEQPRTVNLDAEFADSDEEIEKKETIQTSVYNNIKSLLSTANSVSELNSI